MQSKVTAHGVQTKSPNWRRLWGLTWRSWPSRIPKVLVWPESSCVTICPGRRSVSRSEPDPGANVASSGQYIWGCWIEDWVPSWLLDPVWSLIKLNHPGTRELWSNAVLLFQVLHPEDQTVVHWQHLQKRTWRNPGQNQPHQHVRSGFQPRILYLCRSLYQSVLVGHVLSRYLIWRLHVRVVSDCTTRV